MGTLESYGEYKGGDRCEKIRMDQSQSSRELAFSGSSIEEARTKKRVF